MIDLTKAKLHCRVDHDEEDTLYKDILMLLMSKSK